MAQAAVRSKAVVLLLMIVTPVVGVLIVVCFVVRYCMSILVLLVSSHGKESWLLCSVCLYGVS